MAPLQEVPLPRHPAYGMRARERTTTANNLLGIATTTICRLILIAVCLCLFYYDTAELPYTGTLLTLGLSLLPIDLMAMWGLLTPQVQYLSILWYALALLEVPINVIIGLKYYADKEVFFGAAFCGLYIPIKLTALIATDIGTWPAQM